MDGFVRVTKGPAPRQAARQTAERRGGDPQLSVAAVYAVAATLIPGSRRFKAAVAGIAERSKPAMAGTLGQAAE
jgi:hypothetical protein